MKLSEPKALYRIASYCSKAERCKFDVVKKLQGWELNEEEVARIVERLEKEKFIDERRYCDSFVRDKMRFNKWGKVKIVFELKKKQISKTTIDSVFEDMPQDGFEESLINILKTKERSVKYKTDYEKRTKLIRFALGRGYSMEQTLKCLNKLLEASEDDDYC